MSFNLVSYNYKNRSCLIKILIDIDNLITKCYRIILYLIL
jgi:hypothetical protein